MRYELAQCTRCGALFGLDDHTGCVYGNHTAPYTFAETERNAFASIDAVLRNVERLKRRYPGITVIVDRDKGLISAHGYSRSGLSGIMCKATRVQEE